MDKLESSIPSPFNPLAVRASMSSVVKEGSEIVSARRKTAIWTESADPDRYDRGALICYAKNKVTGETFRNMVFVVDEDMLFHLTSDSPIIISPGTPCLPLENIEGKSLDPDAETEVLGTWGVSVDDTVVETPFIPEKA